MFILALKTKPRGTVTVMLPESEPEVAEFCGVRAGACPHGWSQRVCCVASRVNVNILAAVPGRKREVNVAVEINLTAGAADRHLFALILARMSLQNSSSCYRFSFMYWCSYIMLYCEL